MINYYRQLVTHYEECFLQHGDNHKGVDWPNQADLDTRFRVAYESTLRQNNNPLSKSILDFGCGNGLFVEYLKTNQLLNLENVKYTGVDLSPLFIDCCKKKYPELDF